MASVPFKFARELETRVLFYKCNTRSDAHQLLFDVIEDGVNRLPAPVLAAIDACEGG